MWCTAVWIGEWPNQKTVVQSMTHDGLGRSKSYQKSFFWETDTIWTPWTTHFKIEQSIVGSRRLIFKTIYFVPNICPLSHRYVQWRYFRQLAFQTIQPKIFGMKVRLKEFIYQFFGPQTSFGKITSRPLFNKSRNCAIYYPLHFRGMQATAMYLDSEECTVCLASFQK